MAKSLKMLVVCGHGLGSSMIVKMSVESVLADLKVRGIVESTSVAQAAGMMPFADVVITSTTFFKAIENAIPEGKPVILCTNILDKIELTDKLKNFVATRSE
ncbi:MAG: PTS sugar transporter subunit IIB [Anaerolineaceae bacterium]|jgi:PTS system ascorbate-specific IIB component|nr:MAG: PTS sugar transporter subunit IIB [Anaerolineaceae bacterium]